MQKSNDWSV